MANELVGRNDELAAIGHLLVSQRLVTVVGPGGIGKTALALAAGRERHRTVETDTGGVWLIRLETATNPGEVADSLIATLGVTGGEAALFDRLAAHPSMLILDNCEHVVDGVADLTARLLDATPTLRVLATSQTPLDVDGERLLELAPLDTADAMELFDRRCSSHGRSRPLESQEEVAVLCRALDGLPLAIELAAARTRTLSIAEITRRLDDRFKSHQLPCQDTRLLSAPAALGRSLFVGTELSCADEAPRRPRAAPPSSAQVPLRSSLTTSPLRVAK
ncbi:MAG: ATP-binding protein [Mycobacterium sp.]